MVTCTFGLESILKKEIQNLGYKSLYVYDGKIEFEATLADIPRLNIHLRVADRVLLKLAQYPASDFDELFDSAENISWEDWIPLDAKITVKGKSVKSKLQSVRTCQSMIKKTIIKCLQGKYKVDWLSEEGFEYVVQIALFKDVATLTLDTTGQGLNKRGYRVSVGEAPIRENLAAALVLLSSWNKDQALIDPMCGSGTILIESAMIARNIAPGLNRTFAAEDWPLIDKTIWEDARDAAKMAILPEGILNIKGFDKDKECIKDCFSNAKKCGVDRDIVFECRDIKDLNIDDKQGVVITNPPYGIHVGKKRDLPFLYDTINKVFESKRNWALYLLTSDKMFPKTFKRARPNKIRKLFNGTIEVHYYQYYN